jgi:hypothetical protein
MLRSFDTTITIPDAGPPSPSIFGPTSSDYQAFQQLYSSQGLPNRTSRSSRPSESLDDSSLLYGASSSVENAMINEVERIEKRDLAIIKESETLEDSDLLLLASHGATFTEDYKIRDLPNKGFFFDEENVESDLPFSLQYECARVSLDTGISFRDCIRAVPPNSEYLSFWRAMDVLCQSTGKWCHRTPEKVWNSRESDVGFTAKLRLTQSSKQTSLMKLSLAPRDLQKHSRFHKKFGASRFMYLFLPDFKPIENDKGASLLQKRITQWLMKEKCWLGRTWRALHVEAIKAKDNVNSKQGDKFSYRVIFFAVSGNGIPTTTVEDCINWFIDLDNSENRDTRFCKMYSRLTLGKFLFFCNHDDFLRTNRKQDFQTHMLRTTLILIKFWKSRTSRPASISNQMYLMMH